MTIEFLSFLVGSVLVGVAIIGGGFELKELKIPRVGVLVRLVSMGAGFAFITLALGLWAARNPEIMNQAAGAPAANGFAQQLTDTAASLQPEATTDTAASAASP